MRISITFDTSEKPDFCCAESGADLAADKRKRADMIRMAVKYLLNMSPSTVWHREFAATTYLPS